MSSKPTLGDAVKFLACDIANLRWLKRKCKCEDPDPVATYCAYGNCVIFRCRYCGRYVNVWASRCAVEQISKFRSVVEKLIEQGLI